MVPITPLGVRICTNYYYMLPPLNTYPPGTRLTVGLHHVTIIKYISAGGFAHVYTCTIQPAFHGLTTACLKRVVVPDKTQLTLLRQEVDAMKRLRGNKHIVSYIDSHALRMPHPDSAMPQQYEVLLLMEYCLGKGLIDFMNTRLTHRLTEPEIVSIMRQVTTGVAMCHHLHPPLIHRDIKIENVLIDSAGTYKLCDFGSAVPYSPVPATAAELQTLHEDIMHHTTPQYRAPEMIELSRGFPIDDKLDIWALGVLLYKVCFYTTPFELPLQRTLQDLERLILQGVSGLRFPQTPQFLPRLLNVIRCCLRDDPRRRPNALQLLQEVCLMEGLTQVPDVVPYLVRLRSRENKAEKTDKVDRSDRADRTEKKEESIAAAASKPGVSAGGLSNASWKSGTVGAPKPTGPKLAVLAAQVSSHSVPLVNVTLNTPLGVPLSAKLSNGPDTAPLRKVRPASAIYLSPSAHDSSTSLHDLIKQHVHDSSADVSSIRKSEELDRGTLDFLRSKDEHAPQHTGGSIKASIKNSLRRISTGGSVRSGSLSQQRTSSFSKRGSSSQSSSDENLRVPLGDAPKRMSSIQRRMAVLFKNSDKKAPKTASGYGKYTDTDDILAINHTDLSANVSAESLVSDEYLPTHYEFGDKTLHTKKLGSPPDLARQKSTSGKSSKYGLLHKHDKHEGPPPCPPSLSHSPVPQSVPDSISKRTSKSGSESGSGRSSKSGTGSVAPFKAKSTTTVDAKSAAHGKKPPPKPKKPLHLQVHEEDQRRLSTSSEISLPDVDDLEKQFARRFPSYV